MKMKALFINSNGAGENMTDAEQTDHLNTDHRHPSHVIYTVDASLTSCSFDLNHLDFHQTYFYGVYFIAKADHQ